MDVTETQEDVTETREVKLSSLRFLNFHDGYENTKDQQEENEVDEQKLYRV